MTAKKPAPPSLTISDGGVLERAEPLRELLKGMTERQKEYLYFRVLDLPEERALAFSGVKPDTLVHYWRRQEEFKKLEEYLVEEREVYGRKVREEYIGLLLVKSHIVLNKLIEKGLEWEGLEEKEKGRVMKALEIVSRLRADGNKPEEDKGGYEESLLIKHSLKGGGDASKGREI